MLPGGKRRPDFAIIAAQNAAYETGSKSVSAREILRLTSIAMVVACLAAPPLTSAGAQPAGPSPTEAGPPPPALVGRLAFLQGTVSFQGPGDAQWQAATLNYPVTSGDAFWTEPDALAGIEVAGSRILVERRDRTGGDHAQRADA